MRRVPLLLMALAIAGLLPACASDPRDGYAFNSAWDDSISAVAVSVFDNTTFYTGMETDLTEAVIREIQQRTPWRVTSADRADAVLTGVITDVDLATISRRRGTGLVEEQSTRITVDFTWRDNRTGEALARRQQFAASGASVSARPTNERPEVGQREAIAQLATDIVGELRHAW